MIAIMMTFIGCYGHFSGNITFPQCALHRGAMQPLFIILYSTLKCDESNEMMLAWPLFFANFTRLILYFTYSMMAQ